MAIAGVSANRLELLQIADAVAREKTIDRKIVIQAMEDAIQKALSMPFNGFGNTVGFNQVNACSKNHYLRSSSCNDQAVWVNILSRDFNHIGARHITDQTLIALVIIQTKIIAMDVEDRADHAAIRLQR